jgi:hypothetical protein
MAIPPREGRRVTRTFESHATEEGGNLVPPRPEGGAGMRHLIIVAALFVCLALVAIYGLGPALKGMTSPSRPDAMRAVNQSIAEGMKYPGSR